MKNNKKLNFPEINCPSCNQPSLELEWNMLKSKRNEDKNTPLRLYYQRKEGTLFHCPKCDDEVVTDKNKKLRVQDENVKSITE